VSITCKVKTTFNTHGDFFGWEICVCVYNIYWGYTSI
jgi:hypothetical protein